MALSGDERAELNRLCEAEAEHVARAKADADAVAAAEADVTEPTNYTKLSKKIIRQSRRFSKLKPV